MLKTLDKRILNYLSKDKKEQKYIIADEEYFEALYKKIHNNEVIDFSYTYFSGFSLDEYRKRYSLKENDIIYVRIDNAAFSIFDGQKDIIDFSNIVFIPNDIIAGTIFNDSLFVDGVINFYNCKFSNADVSFDDCDFINCKLKLLFCNEIQNLSFVNAKKHISDFIIYETETVGDLVDFSELNNITYEGIQGGPIIIEKCDFGNSTIKFNNNKSSGNDDYIIFIDNKFNLKKIEIFNSYFFGIIFYQCSFDNQVLIKDSAFDYFILQECVIRDVFKIVHEEIPADYSTRFCFLDTIFNGYFDMDNSITKHILNDQKKFVINYNLDYEDENRFYLDDTSYLEKAIQTNNLSEIYSINGKYKEQDKSYFLSRRYRNLYRIQEKVYCLMGIKCTNEYNYLQKTWLYFIFTMQLVLSAIVFALEFVFVDNLCGNYATNPLKFLAWLISIIVSFGFIIYITCNLGEVNFIANLSNIDSKLSISMLISITNFFQVDFIESGQGTMLYTISLFERILGIIMLAIFTVSYTRKVIK